MVFPLRNNALILGEAGVKTPVRDVGARLWSKPLRGGTSCFSVDGIIGTGSDLRAGFVRSSLERMGRVPVSWGVISHPSCGSHSCRGVFGYK